VLLLSYSSSYYRSGGPFLFYICLASRGKCTSLRAGNERDQESRSSQERMSSSFLPIPEWLFVMNRLCVDPEVIIACDRQKSKSQDVYMFPSGGYSSFSNGQEGFRFLWILSCVWESLPFRSTIRWMRVTSASQFFCWIGRGGTAWMKRYTSQKH